MTDEMQPVQMTSVMADVKEPFLRMVTRYDYMEPWIKRWKDALRYRMLAAVCGVLGVYLLVQGSMFAVLGLAGAAYFWNLHKFVRHRLESHRSVMIGH